MVNASLRWLNNGKLLIFVIPANHKYNCSLIEVDWLAACITQRVVGAVFVCW